MYWNTNFHCKYFNRDIRWDSSHRYRHGGRDRDHRNYSETSSSSNRKLSGYYDGPSDYGRSYSRSTLDYDRSQDYDRNRDREPEPDLRETRDSRVTENRDSRHPRDLWDRDRDRDSRHYDDRRDVGDSKKEAFERHVSI